MKKTLSLLTCRLERLHPGQSRQRVDEREGVDEVEAEGGEDGLKGSRKRERS